MTAGPDVEEQIVTPRGKRPKLVIRDGEIVKELLVSRQAGKRMEPLLVTIEILILRVDLRRLRLRLLVLLRDLLHLPQQVSVADPLLDRPDKQRSSAKRSAISTEARAERPTFLSLSWQRFRSEELEGS